MNLFILDKNLVKAASMLCDKHVIKILIESCQMLYTAHHVFKTKKIIPYRKAYVNYPVTKWVRESLSNYNWTCLYALTLAREYSLRYNKLHKSYKVVCWCILNQPDIKDIGLMPFALAMPEKYKKHNSIKAYRDYYLNEKKSLLAYRNNKIPEFIKNARN